MGSRSKLGCNHPKVERRSRAGVIDAIMYRFGRYPWTCRMCGCRLYFKDRRPSRGERGVVAEQVASARTERLISGNDLS